MNKNFFISISILTLTTLLSILCVYWYKDQIVMLNPKGWIALRELNIIVTSTLLMLIVIIPVLLLTIWVTWKYDIANQQSIYSPEWKDYWVLEVIWWGVPCLIVVALSYITWKTTHELDPFKPLNIDKKPIHIQVVALQWKWLFIYPEQKVATVNYMPFPAHTPVNLELSGDAPMNSFWIPQLAGQIYAMSGMRSKLHLIANEPGIYRGSSSQLSGVGFSGMVFNAHAMHEEDFEKWLQEASKEQQTLGLETYNQLMQPSSYHPVTTYTLQKDDLFHWIVMKPMMSGDAASMDTMEHHSALQAAEKI